MVAHTHTHTHGRECGWTRVVAKCRRVFRCARTNRCVNLLTFYPRVSALSSPFWPTPIIQLIHRTIFSVRRVCPAPAIPANPVRYFKIFSIRWEKWFRTIPKNSFIRRRIFCLSFIGFGRSIAPWYSLIILFQDETVSGRSAEQRIASESHRKKCCL